MKKYGYLIFTFILASLLAGCAANDMTLSNRGYEEMTKANYDEAEKYFVEALYLNPENPYALLNLGQVYQHTGHPERARQMFEKVIALGPSDEERQATSDSENGTPLVEIATENLKLLNGQSITEEPEPLDPIEKPARESVSPMPSSDEMASEPMEEPPEPVNMATARKEGTYSVQLGDNLYDIAGREDVYNYPLKWPTLYRLNMNILENMNIAEDFEYQEVEEGLDLKFVTPVEVYERLVKLGEKLWVVHVRSALDTKNIVPIAVGLMKKGYHVYLTKATVQGKEWTRLRVGFYSDQQEADEARERIVSSMDSIKDAWITKIPKSELDKFGGY